MSTVTKKCSLALLALLAFVAFSPTARADALLPGTTIAGPSNALFFGGVVVASNSGMVSNAAFNGTARVAVVRNMGGTLDFYYQFSNAASSLDSINRLSGFNFAGFTTDVFNITNGSAIGAGFVDGTIDSVSADRNVGGTTVGFNYGGPGIGDSLFIPGTTGLALVIRTNATEFIGGNFAISDGVVENFRAFQPTAVPEPMTLLLLGTGLSGVAAAVRRRRQS